MSSTSPDLSRRYTFAFLVLAGLGAAMGCDSCCADEPVAPPKEAPVCEILTCDDNGSFRYGTCVGGGCSDDSECCPGTRCRTDLNVCFPRLLDSDFACETSADCADPAQVCATVSIDGREPLPTCIYEVCGGDSDCGAFRTCYAGHCIAQTPCGGSCPSGTVCEINSNTCHPLPTGGDKAADGAKQVADSCNQECPNGLIVLADEGAMTGETCCEIACDCVTLPPIVPSRVGRYARVAVTGTEVLVSAFDAEFGDLVVTRYATTGEFNKYNYVDGVPAVTPTNDPSGNRDGIRDPGVDVGTHTSIAVNSAGLARVAYHDVDGNALKVALESAPGVWTSHFVDGAANPGVGQTGTFTDIAVGADGTIFVSYLAHDTTLAGVTGQATGLKLARSRTPTPSSAADWELFVVDARPFVADPALREEPPELPRGRGLHSAIALDGAAAVIGYYDGSDGDVRVARFDGSSAVVSVVDGDAQGGRVGGDVGRYPAVGITDGDLLVVYEDTARHNVRFWKGPKDTPGQGGAYGVADSLRNDNRSGSHFIGAGGRLSTDGAQPVYVQQDASTLDLRFATFDGAAWAPQTLLADGAHGFYADVAVSGGKAFVCSVVAELDSRGKERSRLLLDVQALP
jgi:hypothetical protein